MKIPSLHNFLFGFIIVILLTNLIIYIFNTDISSKKKYYRFGYTEFDLKGIVINKFLDNKNHNYPTIQIEAEGHTYDYILVKEKSRIYDFVVINDSIFNIKGDFNVRIKRNSIDTLITWQSTVNELWYTE